MKSLSAFFLLVSVATFCHANMGAEKVSEDDNFIVYRIPVKDLESQASGYYQGISPLGRSSSKSSSSSKSTSSSTGSGKGKGYGEGSSSAGHGHGHGGSSHGEGYGSSSEGGYSGGHGYGHGGSGGGYGHGGSGGGYGHGGSGGGYGHGGSGGGYGHGGSSGGYGHGESGAGHGYGGYGTGSSGHGAGYGGQGYPHPQKASYTPAGYDEPSDEESDYPKIVTTTKTYTTKSAHDSGRPSSQYRQIPDSLGNIQFRLGDYLKNTPGHEGSASKYSQKLIEEFGAAASSPGYRSGQGFNINDLTRSLNQGLRPSYRNNPYQPQASILFPYALRHL